LSALLTTVSGTFFFEIAPVSAVWMPFSFGSMKTLEPFATRCGCAPATAAIVTTSTAAVNMLSLIRPPVFARHEDRRTPGQGWSRSSVHRSIGPSAHRSIGYRSRALPAPRVSARALKRALEQEIGKQIRHVACRDARTPRRAATRTGG
jgi:hypothetical protein